MGGKRISLVFLLFAFMLLSSGGSVCACKGETANNFTVVEFHTDIKIYQNKTLTNRKVASYNMSRSETHAGFFRLLMKRISDPYVL